MKEIACMECGEARLAQTSEALAGDEAYCPECRKPTVSLDLAEAERVIEHEAGRLGKLMLFVVRQHARRLRQVNTEGDQ